MQSYIGLDAHSKTCTFVCQNENGEILREGTFTTNERNLKGFLKSIPGSKALTFEETNIAQWLYVLLHKEVDRLIVCHPAYLPKKSGPKNDHRDAVHLANQLRANNLTNVFHEDSFLMNLRTLVNNYSDVTQEGTNLKLKYKALLRSQGIRTQSAYKTAVNASKLDEITNPIQKFVAESLFERMTVMKALKLKYMEQFRENMKNESMIRNLASVPGIGPVFAHTIAAFICSGHRFENKHKLWSYAKLIRHNDESDGYILRKRTPHGRSELKVAFMGSAHNICTRSSTAKTAIHKYHNHLVVTKGFDPRKARKATARKIAAICLTIMKNNCGYDDHEVMRSFQH